MENELQEALEGIKNQIETKFENVAQNGDLETKADKAELESKADKAEIAELKESLEAIAAKFDAIPTIINNKEDKKEMNSVNEAFEKSFEETGKYVASVELKAINQTSSITGAPVDTLGLSGARFAANPVRALARNLAVTSSSVVLPRKSGDHAAAVRSATNKGNKATGTAAVSETTILVKTISATSEITTEAAGDIVGFDQFWGQDMLNEVAAQEAAEHVAVIEGLTNGVTAAGATAITLDDLGALVFNVAPQYRANGSLMLSTGAMQAVRTLNQSGNGSDLVFDAKNGIFRLFGYPVYENAYMAAVGASNVVGAFGDFNSGLVVANRAQAEIKRFMETKPGYITYYAEMRSGAGEVDAGAVSKLTMAAS
jgi:HK97 family phage major capsid protein